jgi:hypothetical protein
VVNYQLRQKKQRHHLRWELIMSGGTMRDTETEKPDRTTVNDDGILVDYTDGRFVGQRPVNPVFIDSVNWGITKGEVR